MDCGVFNGFKKVNRLHSARALRTTWTTNSRGQRMAKKWLRNEYNEQNLKVVKERLERILK